MWHHDPRLNEMRVRVNAAFTAMLKARNKVARSSKPASLEAARLAFRQAERDYRAVAEERDGLVEVIKAQWMQRYGKVAP